MVTSVFRLSLPQVERLVRERAAAPGTVRISVHALSRMALRKITRDEVYEVLRKGRLLRAPEPNNRFGTLECRMQRFMAGREVAVVAAVSDADPAVVVVTVMLD